MDKDEIVKEFYTLKDVYNKGWIDDTEFQQRKRQLVDRVTHTPYGEIWNGPGSPSRNSTSIANINPTNAKANLLNKDNNGRKSFSEESHDLLLRENGQNNGANSKENGRNGSLDSSNSKSDSGKRASPDSNGKDPGFESSNPINVSPPNGPETSSDDRNNIDNYHDNGDNRKKVASIDALINKNSPPSTAQPTIVYPVASPGLMMDGIMPMNRMRRTAPSEPSNDDLPEAPVARPREIVTNETNTHKRNYEAALGALTSMSTHIQQDEYERQKKRQRLDPDSEVIVVPATMSNTRDMHSGTMPVFIGQALNIGTLNEKDLVIKSLSEELRKTQTKLRDYEHLEREREMKRQEEERWINMVVDYPRPSMPIYQQSAPSAAYIQSLPTVPSLGNTVPSLSSIGNQSGSSNTGLNPSGMPREPTSNGPAPPTVTIPAPPNPPPSVVNGQTNPIVMMSTIAPNVPGHKSPPPTSGTVSPVPGQVAVIPPMKMNGAPSFQLHVASQPPARVVYQRILKPFPQVQVLGPHQQYQNLYIEATLLRRDTHEEVPHLDGNTLVRVWNGFATFRKLKVTSTSQQSGTLFQLRFSLKQYDSANFKPMACNTVISEPIEVFSHSQYLKQ